MKTFMDSVEKFLGLFVSLLIGAMMLWTFALVITRYCFNFTPSYGEELARYLFVWVVFLSLPIVAKKGAHMAIEMITIRLRGKALKAVRLTSGLLTLIFLILMVYHGTWLVIMASIQTSAALQIPMSWVYVAIPVGCLIMLINVLDGFVTLLRTPAERL